MTSQSNRREFLQRSAGAATAAATLSTLGSVQTLGSAKSETINIGIIGCGGIMTHHVKGLVSRRENVSISYLCDVDPAQIDRMAGVMSGFQSQRAKTASKFETVIEDRNVDAVIIATPHHWHAPIAIAAMQNGKDCYIEKPISHVYDEGPAVIAAAEKYNRVVQQGSQMRSSAVTAKARKLLKEGVIG